MSFSANEAKSTTEQMIGHKIFTKQTGESGRLCSKAIISERLYLRREYYFALLLDRAHNVSLAFLPTIPLLSTMQYLNQIPTFYSIPAMPSSVELQ